MNKPNCYNCIHRRDIPGDAHSQCTHPKSGNDGDDPIMALISIFGKHSGLSGAFPNELNIRGNPHGERMGWFIWPANFDPVWLENCDGFEEEKTKEEDPGESKS